MRAHPMTAGSSASAFAFSSALTVRKGSWNPSALKHRSLPMQITCEFMHGSLPAIALTIGFQSGPESSFLSAHRRADRLMQLTGSGSKPGSEAVGSAAMRCSSAS